MKSVILKPLLSCSDEHKESIRLIRNKESIRRSMYTEHEISPEEHLAWIRKLENDRGQIVFVVQVENEVAGMISLNSIDKLHKKSDWAFYLDESHRGGLGAALEFAFINYAFEEVGLEKLNCEVLETNGGVVKMHKKFSFLEEGFRRSNVEKNGERIGVFFLGLTKEDWIAARARVEENYSALLSKFSVEIVK